MIYVIGDCFVRDLTHTMWDELLEKNNLVFRGHPGQGPFKFRGFNDILHQIKDFMKQEVIPVSNHQLFHKDIYCRFFNPESTCDHGQKYENCKPFIDKLKKLENKENSIIFWFGHADNRDARCNDETREDFMENNINVYIDNIKTVLGKDFKNIYIAEPFPIFINKWEMLEKDSIIHKKLANQERFLFYLRKKCAEENIQIVITQEEILKAAGVDFLDDLTNVPEYYATGHMLPIDQQKGIANMLFKKVLTL